MYSNFTVYNRSRTYSGNSDGTGTAPAPHSVHRDPIAHGPRARFESFEHSPPEQVTTYRPFRHRTARWRLPHRTVRLISNGESRLPFLTWRQGRIWCCVAPLQPYDVGYPHFVVSTCGLRMFISICYLPRWLPPQFLLQRRIYVRRTELRFLVCKRHAAWEKWMEVRGRVGKVLLANRRWAALG